MDRAVYDRMASIDAEHWWFVARRRIVAALIGRFAPRPAMRLLEVGCGTGSNLAMLSRFGHVEAIEPDDGARAIAAGRSGIAIRGGLLPDGVDLPDAGYDMILLLDVLEHIGDDAATLRLLRRKLAPGGRLMLTVPAGPWMWSEHDVAHHHHRRYTAAQLRTVLEAAGFRVIHQSHYNSLLYVPIAAARLIGKMTRRKGGDDAMPAPWLNRLLASVFGSEAHWIARVRMPFGVSLAAVAVAR